MILYKSNKFLLLNLISLFVNFCIFFEDFEEIKIFFWQEVFNSFFELLGSDWIFLSYDWLINATLLLELLQFFKKLLFIVFKIFVPIFWFVLIIFDKALIFPHWVLQLYEE